MSYKRRQVVQLIGATAAVGAIAGCLGDDDDGADDDGGNGVPDDVPEEIHNFLEHANEYDDSIDDQTGESEIRVEVGAGSGGLAFSPAAVRVDEGTTIVWEWTGEGGGHDVVSTGDSEFDFESDRTDEAGHEFEHTFDGTGIALYECRPHRNQGMLGAVEVV